MKDNNKYHKKRIAQNPHIITVKCSVGAYPQGKDFDILHGKKAEFRQALTRIKKLSIPKKDPIFGKEGFLKSWWE
jgi:uncharacterized protein YjlB